MLVRPMLLHRMALVSVRLFCKNLGNLQEFFGQMVYRPPWQKIAPTPMLQSPRAKWSFEAEIAPLSFCDETRAEQWPPYF